tara:strand:+ start:118 stop:384 length:267 start_codon:yes stop_codon:yes gene_type:complete
MWVYPKEERSDHCAEFNGYNRSDIHDTGENGILEGVMLSSRYSGSDDEYGHPTKVFDKGIDEVDDSDGDNINELSMFISSTELSDVYE